MIAAPEPLSAEQIEHERESYKNGYGVNDAAFYAICDLALQALRSRPAGEPVAWRQWDNERGWRVYDEAEQPESEPLYPTPAQPEAVNEVEVIDPWVMDLVREHGATMTNGEIVRKFLPKRRLSSLPQPEAGKVAQGQPDGYAVVMKDGHYVGIWRDRNLAEQMVNRSRAVKDEVIREMYYRLPIAQGQPQDSLEIGEARTVIPPQTEADSAVAAPDSRSRLRRIAAQKGEDMPEFAAPAQGLAKEIDDYLALRPEITAYKPSIHSMLTRAASELRRAQPAGGVEEMVEWVEPSGAGSETTYCRMTKKDCISHQRKVAAQSGHQYETNEQALNDFLVVHWAQLITAHAATAQREGDELSPPTIENMRVGLKASIAMIEGMPAEYIENAWRQIDSLCNAALRQGASR